MFGYTIIKTSELDRLRGDVVALECAYATAQSKLNRILAPLKAANEARRGKKRETERV